MNNQEKTIFAEYHVTVYSDGSITTERIKRSDSSESNRADFNDKTASSKILQIVEALKYMLIIYRNNYKAYKNIDDIALAAVYTRAIKEAAAKYQVTPNSVADKLIRQCSMKKTDWEYALKKMLVEYDCSEVLSILNKNVVLTRIDGDLELINKFNKFYNDKYLNSKEPISIDAELD